MPQVYLKGSEKILHLIKANPTIGARKIAEQMGITARAVEKQLSILKKAATIRRVDATGGGYWEILK